MPEKPPRPIPANPFVKMPLEKAPLPKVDTEGPEIDAGPLRYHPGDRIADKYRLVELLGEGGMGAVWRAENVLLGIDVAIKLLHVDSGDPDAAARLEREANAAARLEHPSIVRIFDLGHTELDDPFIVMELLRGVSLRDHLDERGAIAADKAVPLLLPVASALAAAHARGIVHRDLKPENIVLVENEAGGTVPKVVDFGIAKVETKGRRSTTGGAIFGSPDYMSPEQARGEAGLVDARSDIWTLGVVLYEMLAGRPPFQAENTFSLLRMIIEKEPEPLEDYGVDAKLAAIVRDSMRKNAGERHPDMKSFGRDLAEWALENGIHTDLTGTNIAAHWGRAAHPSFTESPEPPPASSSKLDKTRSQGSLHAVTNKKGEGPGGSRMWLLLVALLATTAGVVVALGMLKQEAPPPDPGAAVASGEAKQHTPAVIERRVPGPLPEAAATADTASGSASASQMASVAPLLAPAACIRNQFPRETFGESVPLEKVCDETDPRRGALLLRAEIARVGTLAKTTTEAMRDWSQLSWYEMAVFAGVRGKCCPIASPELSAPASVGTCPDLGAQLRTIESAARGPVGADKSLEPFRLAVQCLAAAKRMNPAVGTPYIYLDAGEGGAMSAAKRILSRAR